MRTQAPSCPKTERQTTSGRWWGIGSILTALALAGGTCCLAPLLFTVLGFSSLLSLSLLLHLAPYRPVALLITVLCLGFGFYAVYRQGRQARTLDKGILWAATLLVLTMLGYAFAVEGLALFSINEN